MKSLIVSITALAFFGCVLSLAAQTPGDAKKPATPESQPTSAPTTPRPTLALSTVGEKVTKELGSSAVFIELAHRSDDADTRECRRTPGLKACDVTDHWQVVLNRRQTYGVSAKERRIVTALRGLASESKDPAAKDPPGPTSRPAIFGIDGRAAYGTAARLIGMAAEAGFHHLHFLVRPDEKAKTATALRCDLPVDPDPRAKPEGCRLLASYDFRRDTLDRLLVNNDYSGSVVIPDGAEGDEALMTKLRERAIKNAAGAEPILIIDSGKSLCWQLTIDLFSAGRAAGFKDIELGKP